MFTQNVVGQFVLGIPGRYGQMICLNNILYLLLVILLGKKIVRPNRKKMAIT